MKPPFDMSGSRGAQARQVRPEGERKPRAVTGRASFVWLYGVVVPIACGLTDTVEVRRQSPVGPWHTVTGTADEAYDLIRAEAPRLSGLRGQVEAHRRQRGLRCGPPTERSTA